MRILQKTAIRSALLIGLIQALPGAAVAGRTCFAATSTVSPQVEDMCWLTRGLIPEPINEACPVLSHLGCED